MGLERVEQWKEVKGHEGRLEVSSLGRIRSVTREVPTKRGTRTVVGKVLKQRTTNSGYRAIATLGADGRVANILIHRAVAVAFVPREAGLEVVNHKDLNRENNIVSNLEWCNQKENVAHAIAGGTWGEVIQRGEDSNLSRLTECQVREIKTLLNNGRKQNEIAVMYGVTKGTISAIKRGVSWAHVTVPEEKW